MNSQQIGFNTSPTIGVKSVTLQGDTLTVTTTAGVTTTTKIELPVQVMDAFEVPLFTAQEIPQ